MNDKWFVLLVGPTGSGKSKLKECTMQNLGLPDSDTEYMGIDDLVENDNGYKEAVKQLLENQEDCQNYDCLMKNDESILESFNKIYFDARNQGLDEEYDRIFYTALMDKKHIVTEVTGLRGISWFVNLAKAHGYRVAISISLVYFDTLVDANKTRARDAAAVFMKDRDMPAPRLQNVDPEVFEKNVKQIYFNILKMLMQCFDEENTVPDYCGNYVVDKLYVYTNVKQNGTWTMEMKVELNNNRGLANKSDREERLERENRMYEAAQAIMDHQLKIKEYTSPPQRDGGGGTGKRASRAAIVAGGFFVAAAAVLSEVLGS